MAQDTVSSKVNFARCLLRIKPTSSEISKARSYSLSCKKRLSKSFDLKSFKQIGSHSRNEAVKGYSDLDFLAVLSRNEAKWGDRFVSSNAVLSRISRDLNDRYVNTGVRKDGQAVVVSFGGGQNSMDVVPALFHGFINKRPVYVIPDGSGGWLETSPEAHNKYILEENTRSSSKLVKVGQLLRQWKSCRAKQIPISSFYIDMFLAASGICVGVKSYPSIVYDFFDLMYKRNCSGFEDPLGISGTLMPIKTDAQYHALKFAIENGLERATKAISSENKKQFREANKQWDIVFNHTFMR